MTRKELERKYEERGCKDYKLRNLADLKVIHGVNVSELPGYTDLSDKHMKLFESSIIRFFNAHGLDSRKCLQPKCIHYVREIEYEKNISDNEAVLVGSEVNIIDSKTGLKKRCLYRNVIEKDIPFKECRKYVNEYLYFELKNEWFHILDNGDWY